MARPYSLDLRERVIAAVAAGETCRRAIRAVGAKLFFLPPYSPDLNSWLISGWCQTSIRAASRAV